MRYIRVGVLVELRNLIDWGCESSCATRVESEVTFFVAVFRAWWLNDEAMRGCDLAKVHMYVDLDRVDVRCACGSPMMIDIYNGISRLNRRGGERTNVASVKICKVLESDPTALEAVRDDVRDDSKVLGSRRS